MGVGESQYLEFFALKRRVIAAAMKEVNQYADFNIEAEYEKKGRSIIAIRFIIKNKQVALVTIALSPAHSDIEDILIGKLKNYFGLKQRDIDKYLKKYGRKYVEEKVDAILISDSFRNGLIKSMAGYLKTALSEDFQVSISSKKIVEKHRRESEAVLDIQRQREEKLSQLKKAYDYYLSNEICKLMPTVAKQIRDEMLISFEQYLGSGSYLGIFHKEGLDNVLIADRFAEFTKIKYPEILNTMMSFEEYLRKLSANVS
jgi:plasmid replication initiation protein